MLFHVCCVELDKKELSNFVVMHAFRQSRAINIYIIACRVLYESLYQTPDVGIREYMNRRGH